MPLRFESGGQLADGGGFAHAVDPDHQNDRRFGGQVQLLPAAQHLRHDLRQQTLDLVGIGHTLLFHLLAQLVADKRGGVGSHIRHNQNLFQLFKQFLVNFGKGMQHRIDRMHQGIARFFESLSDFTKKAHDNLLG